MYQVADNQLIETMDLLNYYSVFQEWNGSAFSLHNRS